MAIRVVSLRGRHPAARQGNAGQSGDNMGILLDHRSIFRRCAESVNLPDDPYVQSKPSWAMRGCKLHKRCLEAVGFSKSLKAKNPDMKAGVR